MLIHRVDGKRGVVLYYSKCTTISESKYEIRDIGRIQYFLHFLSGRKFKVCTDCNSVGQVDGEERESNGSC